MWIVFNKSGAIVKDFQEYGAPARQGTAGGFYIFVYTEGLEIKKNYIASIIFERPDKSTTSAYLMTYKPRFQFNKNELDDSNIIIDPMMDGQTYPGYIFYVNDASLFSASGTYRATVRIYDGTETFTQGIITFNAQESAYLDDAEINFTQEQFDTIMGTLADMGDQVDGFNEALRQETTNRAAADADLQGQINNHTQDIADLQDALDNKQDKLTFDNTPTANSDNPVTSQGIKSYVDAAVEEHDHDISELEEALEQEISDRQDADEALQDNIDAEETRAKAAEDDLSHAIQTEGSQRESADTALQTAIGAETTRATTAETGLQTAISAEITRATTAEGNLSTAISNEATARANADQALDARITAIEGEDFLTASDIADNLTTNDSSKVLSAKQGKILKDSLDAEESARQTADSNLSTSISNETTRATAAENALNTRIDNLDAASVGSDGSYLKTIVQTDGLISATKQAFDTEITANPSNINAPTTKAVKDYVDDNGGKIDSISVNNVAQTIDANKNVNINLSNYVTLTNAQTISGAKTFTDTVIAQNIYSGDYNGITITGSDDGILLDASNAQLSHTAGVEVNAAAFAPRSNNATDLGTSSQQFKNLYLKGKIVSSSAELTLPSSTGTLALQSAVDGKVDKEAGKGLSTNDFTDALKNKLDGIAAGAEVNVQSNWNESDSTSDAYIQNKPSIYTQSEIDGLLDDKQDTLTFDTTPTANSTNPVTSEGIKTYVDTNGGKINTISIDGVQQTIDANKNVDLPAYPTKASLGLDNVDNTSDLNKPISTATQTALNGKLDKVSATSTNPQAYIKSSSGAQAMLDISPNATASFIPRRDDNGQLNVPETPTANAHASSKKYVDDTVSNSVSTVDNKLDVNVHVEGNSDEITYNGDTVTKVSPYKNLKTGTTGSRSEVIHLANTTTAGMMSPADYNQIRANTARIEQLEGQTRRLLYTASQNPTQQDIGDFVDDYLESIGITPSAEEYAGIAVVIAGTYHIWHYYDTQGIGWRDDGLDTVNTFTNSVAGIILGSSNDGQVFAENNGTGSVYGWSDLKNRVSNVETGLSGHEDNTSNPHGVTKAQVGLGNVDNTSDLNKPISTATQTALNAKANDNAVVHLTGNESVSGVKSFEDGLKTDQIDSFQYDTLTLTAGDGIILDGSYHTHYASVTVKGDQIAPDTDNDTDLGESSYQWKDLYLKGKIKSGSLQFNLPASSGTLALAGDIKEYSLDDTGSSGVAVLDASGLSYTSASASGSDTFVKTISGGSGSFDKTQKYLHPTTTSVVTSVSVGGTTNVVTGITAGQLYGTRDTTSVATRRTLKLNYTSASASGTASAATSVSVGSSVDAITGLTSSATEATGDILYMENATHTHTGASVATSGSAVTGITAGSLTKTDKYLTLEEE